MSTAFSTTVPESRKSIHWDPGLRAARRSGGHTATAEPMRAIRNFCERA
jgi:hypothetical protein